MWVAADSILRLTRVPVAGDELRLSQAPVAGYKLRLRWVLAAGYNLRLTWVPAARYELQLILSSGYLEFRRLDTSYSWLHPTTDSSSGTWIRFRLIPPCGWLWVVTDSSSGGWIWLKTDSMQRLTKSCSWLQFQKLNTSYSWFHPSLDYDLRLILCCGWLESTSWTRVAADICFNISSKFKDLFCKIQQFYGLFSTTWFQLPLIKALSAASRTLK